MSGFQDENLCSTTLHGCKNSSKISRLRLNITRKGRIVNRLLHNVEKHFSSGVTPMGQVWDRFHYNKRNTFNTFVHIRQFLSILNASLTYQICCNLKLTHCFMEKTVHNRRGKPWRINKFWETNSFIPPFSLVQPYMKTQYRPARILFDFRHKTSESIVWHLSKYNKSA